MTDDAERDEAAKKALASLVTEIAGTSARVARWLMLATFEGMFMRSAKSTSQELLAMAENASEGEGRAVPRKRRKGEVSQPLVTWDDLVASVRADIPAN